MKFYIPFKNAPILIKKRGDFDSIQTFIYIICNQTSEDFNNGLTQ